jgi:hypothetical protein
MIDGLIISIAAATLSWELILAPIAAATDTTIGETLFALAYPAGDLILLSVVLRLALGAGRRQPSLYLMIAAALSVLATDSVYSYLGAQGIVHIGPDMLEVGWGAFYVLWGVAALHPSMAAMTTKAGDQGRRPSWIRLAALASATLVTELFQFLQDMADGSSQPILYVATTTLFLLVLIRMADLIQRLQLTAERQRTMREATAALVTSVERRDILHAAFRAAGALTGSAATLRILFATPSGKMRLALAAVEGEHPVAGEPLTLDMADVPNGAWADASDAIAIEALAADLGAALQLPPNSRFGYIVPVLVGAERRGVFVVAGRDRPARSLVDSLGGHRGPGGTGT